MPDLADKVMGSITSQGASVPSAATSPADATPVSAPASVPPELSSSAVGNASTAAGPAGAAAGQQAPFISILDAARQYGYGDIPQGMNEHQFLQHLIQNARQTDSYKTMAGYGQEFLKHREQFGQWLSQQRAAQQAAQAGQQPKWWTPPEFDARWRNQIYRDPQSGELRTLPNVSPTVLENYQKWQEFERTSLDKLLQDPIGTLKPGLQEMMQEMIGQALQGHQAQMQDVQFSQQFLQQNSAWLYEQGQPGGALSQWGQRFKQHVDSLVGMGMRGDDKIAQYAFALTDREYMAQRLAQQSQGQQAAQTGQAGKEQFLQQAAGRTAPVPATGNIPGSGGAGGATQNPNLSLQQRLLQNLKANGVTDDQIRATMPGVA